MDLHLAAAMRKLANADGDVVAVTEHGVDDGDASDDDYDHRKCLSNGSNLNFYAFTFTRTDGDDGDYCVSSLDTMCLQNSNARYRYHRH